MNSGPPLIAMQAGAFVPGTGRDASYAALTPEGTAFCVDVQGSYEQGDGLTFETGVQGCNGVAFPEGHLAVAGAGAIAVFRREASPMEVLRIPVGCTGVAFQSDLLACALGDAGLLLMTFAARNPMAGVYVPPRLDSYSVADRLPKSITPAGIKLLSSPSAGDWKYIEPAWISMSPAHYEVAIAAGRAGVIVMKADRAPIARFGVFQLELASLNVQSIAASAHFGLIAALGADGTVCLLRAADLEPLVAFPLNSPHLVNNRFYRIVCAHDSIAVLTDQNLVWLPEALSFAVRGPAALPAGGFPIGGVPVPGGIDLAYDEHGYVVVTSPRRITVFMEEGLRAAAALSAGHVSLPPATGVRPAAAHQPPFVEFTSSIRPRPMHTTNRCPEGMVAHVS